MIFLNVAQDVFAKQRTFVFFFGLKPTPMVDNENRYIAFKCSPLENKLFRSTIFVNISWNLQKRITTHNLVDDLIALLPDLRRQG